MTSWYEQIKTFYAEIEAPKNLPGDVEVLLPFTSENVARIFDAFYKKYYSDHKQRRFLIGINPGRFGGGVTGIPFTDPIRLAADCDIANDLKKRQELSSVFMYEMIQAYGGPCAFYKDHYITSYSPLGFVKGNKNLNYYDDKALAAGIESFAATCMKEQLSWNSNREIAYCLGDGKNFRFLSKLNQQYAFFKTILPLPHPRFIMQYKLKLKQDYIDKYLQAFAFQQ